MNAVRQESEVATVEVQYGHLVRTAVRDETMPQDVRVRLDRMAALTAEAVGYPIVRREYLWLPADQKDRADPLGQYAVGVVKFWIATPKFVHDIQRDGHIAREGWVPLDRFEANPCERRDVEIADFHFDGKAVRYARVAYGRI